MATYTAQLPQQQYNRLFQRIQTEAQQSLSPEQKTMLLCVGLTASNDPQGVAIVSNLHMQTLPSMAKQVAWIEYLRHALCKAYIICGFPRSWNATDAVVRSLSPEIRDQLRLDPINKSTNVEEATEWCKRGYTFLQDVYRSKAESVESNIKSANPDLWTYAEEAYANALSDMTYMSPVDTELSVIVNLYIMDAGPQFEDHLKGVQNVGGSEQQAQSALHIARLIKEPCSSFHT